MRRRAEVREVQGQRLASSGRKSPDDGDDRVRGLEKRLAETPASVNPRSPQSFSRDWASIR